ncbi:carboxypeptidase-like regulatory domain-containing protein [Flavobacterium sp. 17A]|uniref:Carboxypeptidase-like regulatory domain-containing protein n=1 Tax=Flavobacterium potami TaxID=2872310 RepID=A0A9X1HCT9_9FLAO|nr:carboxypeptidase-like regulatory domain-containing protein [Flavobacterium potami]MBZ4036948.1 carboxypeptidase-like regulatory domain-containing protein [Flavobacterium potami]
MEVSKAVSVVFFVFFAQTGFGQVETRQLYGRIMRQSSSIEGVNIVNNNSQIAAVSNIEGDFSIAVKEGDVFVFSAVNLNPVKKRITQNDMVSSQLFIVEMTTKEVELQEVVVNENANITAENLGIIPKGQKKYTQAERQLATAGDFKPIMLLGLLGGSMQLDPLINKINGRTKRLKANVEIEKREKNLLQLGYLFDETYFIQKLNITKDNVNEFKLYAIENDEFCTLMNSKNKTSTEFLLGELAVKYKEIKASENK